MQLHALSILQAPRGAGPTIVVIALLGRDDGACHVVEWWGPRGTPLDWCQSVPRGYVRACEIYASVRRVFIEADFAPVHGKTAQLLASCAAMTVDWAHSLTMVGAGPTLAWCIGQPAPAPATRVAIAA